jgi:hypothetical protein
MTDQIDRLVDQAVNTLSGGCYPIVLDWRSQTGSARRALRQIEQAEALLRAARELAELVVKHTSPPHGLP